MILFGGIVDITKEINELHQFDFGKKSWEQIDDDVAHKDGIERSPSPRKPRRDFNRDPAADTTIRSKPGKSPNKKKTNDPMRDRNFFLPKEIPKNKKRVNGKKREQYDEMRRDLTTPISESLRNTFVINSSESFDGYYSTMKK